MKRFLVRMAAIVVCSAACAHVNYCAAVDGHEPEAKPKVPVELRWVETRRIEGLTEEEGFQSSCDPADIVYPHKEPALALTRADVTEFHVVQHDLFRSSHYMVSLHLTDEARAKLAAACGPDAARMLTVVVDGKCWGLRRYETTKDNALVPLQARAETFVVEVGFFSSFSEAQRLANAFK